MEADLADAELHECKLLYTNSKLRDQLARVSISNVRRHADSQLLSLRPLLLQLLLIQDRVSSAETMTICYALDIIIVLIRLAASKCD